MEKLDFPIKKSSGFRKRRNFCKKVWSNRQGKGDFFSFPVYRHTVKQEQYSFKCNERYQYLRQVSFFFFFRIYRHTVTQEKYSFKGNVRPSVLALSAFLSAQYRYEPSLARACLKRSTTLCVTYYVSPPCKRSLTPCFTQPTLKRSPTPALHYINSL